MHADFGSGQWNGGPIGIPYVVVNNGPPRVTSTSAYAGKRPGPYPIPSTAPIEGGQSGGDRHVLVVDHGTCRLYELYVGLPAIGDGAGGPTRVRSST